MVQNLFIALVLEDASICAFFPAADFSGCTHTAEGTLMCFAEGNTLTLERYSVRNILSLMVLLQRDKGKLEDSKFPKGIYYDDGVVFITKK